MTEIDRIRRGIGPGAARAIDSRASDPDSSGHRRHGSRRRDLGPVVTALREAAREQRLALEFRLDDELEAILVLEPGSGRIVRRMDAEEALRLADLLRAGRQQLLDRTV